MGEGQSTKRFLLRARVVVRASIWKLTEERARRAAQLFVLMHSTNQIIDL